MHLNCALTVSDIVNCLIGHVIYIFKHCRKVEVSHVLEWELPECCIFVWVQFSMSSWVFVSSAIAHPDIIPCVSKQEARGLILVVDKPGVWGIKKPMLKKHGFKPAFDCRPLFLDSKHFENISIIRDHIVGFCGVAEVFAVVQEVKLCFRVHFCSSQEGKDSQNEDESLVHGGFTIMYTNSRKN